MEIRCHRSLHSVQLLVPMCFSAEHRLRIRQPDVVEPAPCRGNTALHLAALSGKDSMAELLLKHGADIDAKDKDGPGPGGRFCSVLVAWEWPEAFMG